MKTKRSILVILCLAVMLLAIPLWAADAPTTAAPATGQEEESMTEVNKKLTNPVSSLWSITFQQNNYALDMGPGREEHWNSNLNLQPVMPVALTEDWNLITRPAFTLFNSVPHPDAHNPQEIDRTTRLGDTVLLEMFSPSPKLVGNWLLGLGPTFIFPTASPQKYTGQGKWQVGPGVLAGYLFEEMDPWGLCPELAVLRG
jgi:hypothetical protein